MTAPLFNVCSSDTCGDLDGGSLPRLEAPGVSVSARPSTSRPFVQQRDRRHANRLTIPDCGQCASSETAVATRTTFVLYIRCAACCHVWSVPKPTFEPVGACS